MALRSDNRAPTWDEAARSYRLSLQADGKQPDTLKSYDASLDQFRTFLVAENRPTDPDRIGRDDVAAFIAHLRLKKRKPGTIATRYDGLKGFFRWLEDEGEIGASPMAKMHRPTAPMTDVPLIPLEVTRELLASCDRRSFNGRRDEALLLTFLDTGLRIGGLVSMTVPGTDLQKGTAAYRKKGGDPGEVPLGRQAARALDRYLRARSRHRLANRPEFWLGLNGPLTTSGARQVLTRHAAAIGVPGLYPHMFRHNFADWWLRHHPGEETILIELMGWTSAKQLLRYGRAGRRERARELYRKRSPGDDLG